MNKTIPIFPCKSLEEVVVFYEALGFDVTYIQSVPYGYAAVKHRIGEVNFTRQKNYEKEKSINGAYILVEDVESVYSEFISNLKKVYGKVFRSGEPRITKVSTNKEDIRFNLVDPAGNYLIIGQKKEREDRGKSYSAGTSTIEKRFYSAYTLAHSKNDYRTAYKIIEGLTGKKEEMSQIFYAKLLILKLEIEFHLERGKEMNETLAEITTINLNRSVFERLLEEKQRLQELLEEISPKNL